MPVKRLHGALLYQLNSVIQWLEHNSTYKRAGNGTKLDLII